MLHRGIQSFRGKMIPLLTLSHRIRPAPYLEGKRLSIPTITAAMCVKSTTIDNKGQGNSVDRCSFSSTVSTPSNARTSTRSYFGNGTPPMSVSAIINHRCMRLLPNISLRIFNTVADTVTASSTTTVKCGETQTAKLPLKPVERVS
jgi:hypothetical protein